MTRFTLTSLTTLLVCAFAAVPSHAQTRVFVAAQGSDSNPCTFAAPCRTFQHAHDTVAANGEIDVLDPAGYGALTITKPISIQAHGFAGISATSGNAIHIHAGGGDRVSLHGLLIDGGGVGTTGIFVDIVGLLTIQDSVIRNFTRLGIDFEPISAATLVVTGTVVSDNTVCGIAIDGKGTQTIVNLVNDQLISNLGGNLLFGVSTPDAGLPVIAIMNSALVGSNGSAIRGTAGSLVISSSMVANNAVGIDSVQNSSFRLDRTQFFSNVTTWQEGHPGNVKSYGNNPMDSAGPTVTALQ